MHSPPEESLERGQRSRAGFPPGLVPRPVGAAGGGSWRAARRLRAEPPSRAVLLGGKGGVLNIYGRAGRLTLAWLGHHQLAFSTLSLGHPGAWRTCVPGPSQARASFSAKAQGIGGLQEASELGRECLWIIFILQSTHFSWGESEGGADRMELRWGDW